MKKRRERAIVEGFANECGLWRNARNSYEPFWKKGKAGIRNKYSYEIVLKPDFSYIKMVDSICYNIYFIAKIADKYQLYSSLESRTEIVPVYECDGIETVDVDNYTYFKMQQENYYALYEPDARGGIKEVLPMKYSKIEMEGEFPIIFRAYPDPESEQFDMYARFGNIGNTVFIGTGCQEYSWENHRLKIKFIDGEQALWDGCQQCIIEKGNHQIILKEDVIWVVKDNKPVIYSYQGRKISEDISGSWERFGNLLVHITDENRTFYDKEGYIIDLNQYEDYREEKEFVFVKDKGHWNLLWSI